MRMQSATLRKQREKYTGLLFMLPWIFGFLVFIAYPLIYSFWLSFTNYRLFGTDEFIGFGNYINMVSADSRFSDSVSVTLSYVFISVPLQLVFALSLALLLNRDLRGITLHRAIYYIPSLLGDSVAIAMMWRLIFGSAGLFNQILLGIGVDAVEGLSWYSDPRVNLFTLIALRVWQFGSPMIIFLAALKQIPLSLYESARIDGASAVTQFWKITLPFLTPVLLFNSVMQTNSAFKTFAPAFILSNGTGGRLNSLLFYTLEIYRVGFVEGRMGYASGLAWLLVLTIAAVSGLVFWSSKRWVYYNE